MLSPGSRLSWRSSILMHLCPCSPYDIVQMLLARFLRKAFVRQRRCCEEHLSTTVLR